MNFKHQSMFAEPYANVSDLSLTYPTGVKALESVSFQLAQGEFVSLVGPSGCGKSTVLKVLAGLLPSSSGTLRLGAARGDPGRTTNPDVAFVFQQPTLLGWRTVAGNVRLPLELRGAARAAEGLANIDRVLDWVGLSAFAGAFPSELSGGMQMRVSLARALVLEPRLLLMDEPFAALDDLTRQRLNEDLTRMWDRARWNALFVTHNVSEAVVLSQRVLVMSARPGRLIADIAIPLPYPRPQNVRTSSLFISIVAEVSRQLAKAG